MNNRLMYDHLTQAFSRSYLEIRLSETINLMSRNELGGLSVCVFDIDNFKNINDQFGHANGDELLKKITKITKGMIRESDCIARLGGDEFVILLSGKQHESSALLTIDNIRKRISETRFGDEKHKFNASCSFGIVSAEPEQTSHKDLSKQLLSAADEALYSAKNKGKNAVELIRLNEHIDAN